MNNPRIIRYSENLPVSSDTFAPETGTRTLTGVYVSLQDAQNNVVSSVSAIAATGFIDAPSKAPYGWHKIHPKITGLPIPTTFQDCYSLWFLAQDTDGNTHESVIGLVVRRDGT